MMHFYGFGMGWMMIIPIILVLVIIYSIFKLFEHRRMPNKSEDNNNRAIEILKERFVKGEIDEEEYNKKRNMLRK